MQIKDKFSWPWVSSGLWDGPSPRNLQKVLITAPSGNGEGGHKILPLVQHLNVNFKNMNPPYPFTLPAVQVNPGGQGTEGQQEVCTWVVVRLLKNPTRYTAFSQPHPFPHLVWAFRKDGGKKCNPFPPHSQPWFLRQPESNKIWSRVMAEAAAYCNFQSVVSPCEELNS